MSTGTRLPLAEATELARKVSEDLTPAVDTLKCVGSVRRRRPTCGDIEFLARPFMQPDLVGDGYPILEEIESALATLGTRTKGGDRMLQITNLYGLEGLKLDLYLCWGVRSWGSLLAIRTGPWPLGKYVMGAMKQYGYRHVDGHAERIDTGEVVPTPEEADFFALAQVPCVPPRERDALAEKLRGAGR